MKEVKKDSVENSLKKSMNVKEDPYKKSILVISSCFWADGEMQFNGQDE